MTSNDPALNEAWHEVFLGSNLLVPTRAGLATHPAVTVTDTEEPGGAEPAAVEVAGFVLVELHRG